MGNLDPYALANNEWFSSLDRAFHRRIVRPFSLCFAADFRDAPSLNPSGPSAFSFADLNSRRGE
jgi:hypothetical protein